MKKLIVMSGLIALMASGETLVKADQGAPGNQGPWPVTIVGGTGGGGGSGGTTSVVPAACATPTQTVTSVGLTAGNCAASNIANRTLIVFCNSPENAGTPKVKLLINGGTPAIGATNPGDVLNIGDCISYAIPAGVNPQCISDTAATALTVIQCS